MDFERRKRQTYDVNDAGAGQDYYWNYSTTAVAIKWAVIGAIVLAVILWFVGGYYHAQRRIRNGKRPFAYHMFLVPRRQRAQFFPQQNLSFFPQPGVYRPQEFPLQAYPPPPPAYNADHYAPPQYQPPQGGTKVAPEQDYTAPPPGAPPGDMERGESSNAAASSGNEDVHRAAASAGSPEVQGNPTSQDRPRSGLMARMNPFNYGSAGTHH